jgi:putative FmdB family regulatory protein
MPQEDLMPSYDYRCGKCGKRFEVTISVSDRDAGKVKCAKCGSRRVRQQVSGFSVKTSRKS